MHRSEPGGSGGSGLKGRPSKRRQSQHLKPMAVNGLGSWLRPFLRACILTNLFRPKPWLANGAVTWPNRTQMHHTQPSPAVLVQTHVWLTTFQALSPA